jgi:dipeptidyl aminopeptidase/acylaminoacyl peptidase
MPSARHTCLIVRHVCTILAALGVGIVPAAAQSPRRPMDVADIFRLAQLGQAELSPDGRWVVYEVTRVEFPDWQRRTDLYLVSADGRVTRRLTRTPGDDETGPRWHPGSGTIGFTSTRDGKQRQLFLIPAAGGESQRVTSVKDGIQSWAWNASGDRLAVLAGTAGERQISLLAGDGAGPLVPLTRHATGVDAFWWSTDGRRVLFAAPDAADSIRRRRDREKFDVRVTDEPRPPVHLWVIDVASGVETRLTTGDLRITGPVHSRDGRWIAFRASRAGRPADERASEVYLLDLRGGAPQQLTDNYVPEASLAFSPDSRLLGMVADRAFTWGAVSRVYVRPVTGGAWRELGEGHDRDAGLDAWAADGRTIYFDAVDGVRRQAYALDVAAGSVRAVTRADGALTLTVPRERSAALLRYTDAATPTDLYLVPLADLGRRERWVRLTRLNPWVDSLTLARTEVVRWRAGDGVEVEGMLYHPVGRAGPAPLVVQLHGGPAAASQNAFDGTHRNYPHVLAGRGYAVFQPNYRGSVGYGERFQDAIAGNYWPLAQEDIESGVDTLIGRAVAHPDSLAMMGWSAGGHWSNWTLVTTTRYKAIASGAGVASWISLYAQSDVQATREYYVGGNAGRDGGNKPWDDWEHWWAESPLRYVVRARTPILFHWGEKDERVPLPQGLEWHMALKQLGVPTELLVYPGQPHGLQEPRYQLVKVVAELGWFERWLRGAPGWLDWEGLLRLADGIAKGAGSGEQGAGR